MTMQGVMKPDYTNTSLQIPRPIRRPIDLFLKAHGVSHVQVYMALMRRLLCGDIKIEAKDYGNLRIVHSVNKCFDDYYDVELYDRNMVPLGTKRFVDLFPQIDEL